jgi:hypothetical protein
MSSDEKLIDAVVCTQVRVRQLAQACAWAVQPLRSRRSRHATIAGSSFALAPPWRVRSGTATIVWRLNRAALDLERGGHRCGAREQHPDGDPDGGAEHAGEQDLH